MYRSGGGRSRARVKDSVKSLHAQACAEMLLRMTRRRVVFGEPQAPTSSVMLELRRRFKGEVVALSEYLDRDLVSLWGYDGIG